MSSLNTVAPQAKYGLIKKSAPIPKRAILKQSAFAEELDELDSNDKNDQKSDVKRVNERLAKTSTINVVTDDIYDYDSYLENKEKTSILPDSKLNIPSVGTKVPTASYVHNLKAAAIVREKEKDRLFEKKLIKERELEEATGEVAEDKKDVKFITSAYKQKLMEQRKWELEDK